MNVHFTGRWYGVYSVSRLMHGCEHRPESRRRIFGAMLLACLMGGITGFGLPVAATVDFEAPLDYQVEAAMLYKFLAYIDWPATAFANEQSPYRIAVFGAGEIEEELRQITAERTVNNRRIEVVRVSRTNQIDNPHMVFVGSRAEKYLPRLARLARERSFLIITENDVELKEGSAINLRLVNGRIGFDVSLPDANKSNIRLSARLLSVASSVERMER